MQIQVSRTIDGPPVNDNLEKDQVGLDLTGSDLGAGIGGDFINFSLYIKAKTSPDEDIMFDGVDNFGLFLDIVSNYTGDYNKYIALEDILNMGDQGSGLKIKNPSTGLYDYIFNNSNSGINKRYVIKKEQVLWYNKEIDSSNPTIIKCDGFDNAIVDNSSTGTNLKIDKNVFKLYHVGCKIFNDSKNDYVIVEEIVGDNEVIVNKSINWDGDSIYMLRLESAEDGVLGFKQAAEDYGDMVKIDFRFEIPDGYSLQGIKQFTLKFAWYKETE